MKKIFFGLSVCLMVSGEGLLAQSLSPQQTEDMYKQAEATRNKASEDLMNFLFTKNEQSYAQSQAEYKTADSLYSVVMKNGSASNGSLATLTNMECQTGQAFVTMVNSFLMTGDKNEAPNKKVKFRGESHMIPKSYKELFSVLKESFPKDKQ